MGTDVNHKDILIVGGGYVGLYTALRLRRRLARQLRDGSVRVTIVTPESHMTYQPFLPEAAAGNLSPRHVVAPLRRVLPGVRVLNGKIIKVDHADRRAVFEPAAGDCRDLSYDILVMAAGSISRTLPIPGLTDIGIGFKTVGEAIGLRNRVLHQLDVAESTDDPQVRRRALTFVVVGAGFAGVEALAELEDMSRHSTRYYRNIRPRDLRWVLVEATDRVLPEVGPEMGRWTLEQLRERGIDVRLRTRLESCVGGRVVLSDGDVFEADTLVWTAGVKSSPIAAATGLPLDARGRIATTACLTVRGVPDAFAAGDIAGVPDVTAPGEFCAPNAQHAVRQAKVLADNIVRHLHGREPVVYRHRYVGSVAGLGLHQGVANVYGMKLRGFPAWFMHRTYHLSRIPTLNRKVRVVVDWTLALLFKRETISLGEIHHPRDEFRAAAASVRKG